MTAPQNPASAPGPAGFDARREAGGRRRAEPMRGSLGDAGPGGPPRPAPRSDLRAEFAALANEPHPFAFWQRLEQLPERFEREHRSAPAPVAPPRPSTGGLPSLSGDLGGDAPRPPEGMSGSLDSAAASEAERRPEFTGGLSGSLIPPQPDSTPLAPNPHERAAEESAPSGGPALRGDLPRAEPTHETAPTHQTAPAPDGPAAPQHAQVASAPTGPPPAPTGPPPAPMGPPSGPMPQAEPPESSHRHNAPEPPRPQSGPPQPGPPQPGPPPAGPPAGPTPHAEQPPAGPPPGAPPAAGAPPARSQPAGPPPAGPPPAGPPPAGPPPAGPPPAGPPSGPLPQAAPGQQPPQGPPAGRPSGPPAPPPPQGHPPAPPQPPGPPPQQPPQQLPPQQAPQQQAPQPPQQPPPQQAPQQPQRQERASQQGAERADSAQSSRSVTRMPKPVERADGGFGPMGSAGTWAAGAGKAGYGRTPAWSPEDFKEERRDGDELRAGAGYKPGETGSGAVPQFLIEADELFDEEDDGGRLVAPPVLGESPSSFRDF